MCSLQIISAQTITGSGSVTLKGPATRDQVITARISARSMLKAEIVRWLDQHHETKLDTTNSLENFHMEMFIDTCLNRIKEEVSYKGKDLVLTFTIETGSADDALKAFNTLVKAEAENSYTLMADAQKSNDIQKQFTEAIKTYSFAKAHIGPPLATPGTVGNDLTDVSHKVLQTIIDRVKVQSSDMMIHGKIGRPSENPPTITITADSVPLSGVGFNGTLQNGKKYYSSIADEKGEVSLKNTIIPFVATGTMLTLTPDFGEILGTDMVIEPSAFKLSSRDGQTQTFMFKIIKPTYSLEYKMDANASVKIPGDFFTSANVKKFLQDSCLFVEAPEGLPPDFMITINSQITSVDHEKTEEIGLLLNSEITIKGLSLETPKTEQKKITFEKKYEKSLPIPYGLYLWDVNGKMKQFIKETLNAL
jgi:hypothetical protein